MFLNDGDGTFSDISVASGTSDSGMTWGCVFFDYDHDGEWDLYIVNDYLFAPLPNILYHGNGDNTFTPVSAGNPTLERTVSDYGLAMGDLDRDGDLDLVVKAHLERPPNPELDCCATMPLKGIGSK